MCCSGACWEGSGDSELALQSEENLINVVMDELNGIMDLKIQPDFAKVYTHKKGIPQYSPGHEKRLKTIQSCIVKFKRFYITGNAYRGISVNDCIDNSHKLAERIIQEI